MTRVPRTGMPDPLAKAVLRWMHEHNDRGVFTTDVSLRVQSWNHWVAGATGVTVAEAAGRPLFELFPNLVARGFDQYYAEALAGQVKILSHALHRYVLPSASRPPGEQMPQRGHISPLRDGDQIVGTITIIEDVSERIAAERELRARIATAERARGLAEEASRSKDEFLATLSHEIRTPLNAVLGWTRILLTRDLDRATLRRAVEVIDRNASAQLTLITDMLDMARISTGKIRLEISDVDLNAVALAAIDVVRPAADAKGVRLVTDLAPRLPAVAGDRERLLQVVWNLLSNAVKFTDSGGRVTLAVNETNGGVRLSVVDTGGGIAPEFLPQVFERFKQADASSSRRHGGLGLGLALVRELVELHGGSASAESPGVGHGSSFTVTLPARPAEVPFGLAKLRPDAVEASGALVGVHVLIVEDDDDAREIIARSVTDAGGSVTAVESAAAALSVLRKGSHTDVVVTDIGMPGDDGYAFLRELRSLPREYGGRLPAIAVTAYVSAEDRRRALSQGFAAHIPKPFAPLTLISTIVRAVEQQADDQALNCTE